MTVEEAFAKAEEQLSHCIYLAETSTKPGIAKINSNKAGWLSCILHYAKKALRDLEERENPKQLTLEEMLNMNAPVWLSCFMLDGSGGYWCICQEGSITCPSGLCYDVRDIPTWKFYRYQPKGNDPCSKS